MGRRRRITCCRIPPGQECALVAQSYGEQKWSHFVGIKDRVVGAGGLEVGGGSSGGGSSYLPAPLLFPKPFK